MSFLITTIVLIMNNLWLCLFNNISTGKNVIFIKIFKYYAIKILHLFINAYYMHQILLYFIIVYYCIIYVFNIIYYKH
jgi:hypothetical protein